MATPSIQLAEAVAAALVAENSDWLAERKNFPLLRKEDVPNSGFVMQVIPNGYQLVEDAQARSLFTEMYSVAVSCYRKANTVTEQDAALEDIDDVRQFLMSESLTQIDMTGDTAMGNARLMPTMLNSPEYDFERLKDENVFQSVIQLDYILYRERAE
mgnify:CR=1 FL=1